MRRKTLDIFVDESGSFSYPDDISRFYIICAVLHNSEDSIDLYAENLDRAFENMKLANLCFHAGPIIRHERGFEFMNWELRSYIFSKMMAFARQVDFSYRCICVDKKFVGSLGQILANLRNGLRNLATEIVNAGEGTEKVRVFYDKGQTQITDMLSSVLPTTFKSPVEFVPDVKPAKYKLFQLADLLCTVELISQKLDAGLTMTQSENRFFGGPKAFKHNILRRLKGKKF